MKKEKEIESKKFEEVRLENKFLPLKVQIEHIACLLTLFYGVTNTLYFTKYLAHKNDVCLPSKAS